MNPSGAFSVSLCVIRQNRNKRETKFAPVFASSREAICIREFVLLLSTGFGIWQTVFFQRKREELSQISNTLCRKWRGAPHHLLPSAISPYIRLESETASISSLSVFRVSKQFPFSFIKLFIHLRIFFFRCMSMTMTMMSF